MEEEAESPRQCWERLGSPDKNGGTVNLRGENERCQSGTLRLSFPVPWLLTIITFLSSFQA